MTVLILLSEQTLSVDINSVYFKEQRNILHQHVFDFQFYPLSFVIIVSERQYPKFLSYLKAKN